MEPVNWLEEIEGKRPNGANLWSAYKKVMVRTYNADADIKHQVNLWKGNTARRSLGGGFPFPGSVKPWFYNWPGWAEVLGPDPSEPPMFGLFVEQWVQAHPEDSEILRRKQRAISGPLSKADRFRILARDRFTCRYCGVKATGGATLHVDHVKPRSKGGTNDPSNLVTACSDCNLGKSDTTTWSEE